MIPVITEDSRLLQPLKKCHSDANSNSDRPESFLVGFNLASTSSLFFFLLSMITWDSSKIKCQNTILIIIVLKTYKAKLKKSPSDSALIITFLFSSCLSCTLWFCLERFRPCIAGSVMPSYNLKVSSPRLSCLLLFSSANNQNNILGENRKVETEYFLQDFPVHRKWHPHVLVCPVFLFRFCGWWWK